VSISSACRRMQPLRASWTDKPIRFCAGGVAKSNRATPPKQKTSQSVNRQMCGKGVVEATPLPLFARQQRLDQLFIHLAGRRHLVFGLESHDRDLGLLAHLAVGAAGVI